MHVPSLLFYTRNSRLSAGALFQSFIPVPRSLFTLNDTNDSLKTYKPGPNSSRQFCSSCSTSLFMNHDKRPSTIDVALAALEKSWATMQSVKVIEHIYMSSVVPRSFAEMKELEDGVKRKEKM
jgi:hypothetical protein